jgi:hypothetical protein
VCAISLTQSYDAYNGENARVNLSFASDETRHLDGIGDSLSLQARYNQFSRLNVDLFSQV